MYFILDVDSNIDETMFDWDFQYKVIFFVNHGGMWSLILHVEDNEKADVVLLEEEDIPKDVY